LVLQEDISESRGQKGQQLSLKTPNYLYSSALWRVI